MIILNVVIVGPQSHGKSSLLQKLRGQDFSLEVDPTIGGSYTEILKNPGTYAKKTMRIWDTSGDKKYNSLLPMYCRSANTHLYCTDLSKSIDDETIGLKQYIRMLQRYNPQKENYQLILIGTKSDLVSTEELPAKIRQLQSIASQYHCSATFISSAKENAYQEITDRDETTAEPLSTLFDTIFDLSPELSPYAAAALRLEQCLNISGTDNEKRIIAQAFDKLTTTLRREALSSQDLAKAIERFENDCNRAISPSTLRPLWEAISRFISATIVAVFVGVIGFGIGVLAGAWSGPGAFLSGLIAGRAAALSVAGVSGLFGFFALPPSPKKKAPIVAIDNKEKQDAIHNIALAAENEARSLDIIGGALS